ncbi:MAG: hypothetical protein ACTSRZ_08195 [Promethearchaeota archaeon]
MVSENYVYDVLNQMEDKIKSEFTKNKSNFPMQNEIYFRDLSGWGKTAIKRYKPSNPLTTAMRYINLRGLIGLDFGCGRSIDAEYLCMIGAKCIKYDIVYFPSINLLNHKGNQLFDFILCIYVLNVVPFKIRQIIANTIIKLINKEKGIIILGLREDIYSKNNNWIQFEDGYITSRGTFQKIYFDKNATIKELEDLFPNFLIHRLGRGTWLLKVKKF